MLTPYPGTVDFERWERDLGSDAATVGGIPITRHWLIPQVDRPKAYAAHPVMSPDEIRRRTQAVWDNFYALPRDLATIAHDRDVEGPARVRAQLEVISTDVCQYRDCDRFRATHTIGPCRPLDGGAGPPALYRSPDSAPRSAPNQTTSRTRGEPLTVKVTSRGSPCAGRYRFSRRGLPWKQSWATSHAWPPGVAVWGLTLQKDSTHEATSGRNSRIRSTTPDARHEHLRPWLHPNRWGRQRVCGNAAQWVRECSTSPSGSYRRS